VISLVEVDIPRCCWTRKALPFVMVVEKGTTDFETAGLELLHRDLGASEELAGESVEVVLPGGSVEVVLADGSVDVFADGSVTALGDALADALAGALLDALADAFEVDDLEFAGDVYVLGGDQYRLLEFVVAMRVRRERIAAG
jgi:hypothetical protein